MLILSRVCADFRDRAGNIVHRVTPVNRLTFHEAPDSIREDPLFRLLVNDGSLEATPSAARRKKLEADPLEPAQAAEEQASAEMPAGESPAPKGASRPSKARS